MRLGCDEACFSYPRAARLVLDHVSFDVAEGTTVALMGPSGSGKTTLLSLLGGLVDPTAGSVYPSGRERKQSLVGWVFQTVNVLGRRSALDNVALGGMARGKTQAAARQYALTLLESVGLGAQAEQRASRLSGGELQRVVIARALAAEPEVLIADEPTGQLDAAMSDQVMDALILAKPLRTTVLVATHDPAVADRCGVVLRLKSGKIQTS